MQAARARGFLSTRRLLLWDALFELAAGLALLVPASPVGRSVLLSTPAAAGLGVLFLIAAVAIAALLSSDPPPAPLVRGLALANLAGAAAAWLLLIALWTRFPPLGRFALGTVGDACLLLGALELLALRPAR